jgi:hypothetical protein
MLVDMRTAEAFAIRYGRWRPRFSILGIGPRCSRVELGPSQIRVRIGNLRGAWLVNGSATGLPSMDLAAPGRAGVLGVPVTVRKPGLGLVDPDGFLAALGVPPERTAA